MQVYILNSSERSMCCSLSESITLRSKASSGRRYICHIILIMDYQCKYSGLSETNNISQNDQQQVTNSTNRTSNILKIHFTISHVSSGVIRKN